MDQYHDEAQLRTAVGGMRGSRTPPPASTAPRTPGARPLQSGVQQDSERGSSNGNDHRPASAVMPSSVGGDQESGGAEKGAAKGAGGRSGTAGGLAGLQAEMAAVSPAPASRPAAPEPAARGSARVPPTLSDVHAHVSAAAAMPRCLPSSHAVKSHLASTTPQITSGATNSPQIFTISHSRLV